jgi:hypothetical protein
MSPSYILRIEFSFKLVWSGKVLNPLRDSLKNLLKSYVTYLSNLMNM